ncbi:hypothetical protein HIM_02070 [Hirsutella minnesotensis 3608]|nr:hypothetical protein HIM_02070 [Hirsutella minnesotensis 3608]
MIPTRLSTIERATRHVLPLSHQLFSTCGLRQQATESPEPKPAAFNARWFADLQERIRTRCSNEQDKDRLKNLQSHLDDIDKNWLELSAGREGFLTAGRWRGHVNNVIYNRYAESARVTWLTRFAATASPEQRPQWNELMTPRGIGLILRSIKTDYKLPITYPDNVTVLHKLSKNPEYGSDSIDLEAVIFSERHKRPAARCFEDIVVFDYRTAKRAPLADFMVDRLREVYKMQQENREQIEKRLEGFNQSLV